MEAKSNKIIDKFLQIFNTSSKKGVENLIILLILIVILVIFFNTYFSDEENSEKVVNVLETQSKEIYIQDSLELKLSKILSQINGAGEVDVMISYKNTEEKIPIYDSKEIITITEESDNAGGERKTKETTNEYNVVYEQNSNNKNVLIGKSNSPEIIGVIVVASGANNSLVKENIINAVMSVTDLKENKIQVFSR